MRFGGRTFDTGVSDVVYRGPGDLYLGVVGSAIATLGVGALYFATYQAVKKPLDERLAGTTWEPAAHVVAASAGAACSAVVRVPGDTIKHRTQAYLHPNAWAALTGIVRAEGVAGLYRGFGPTLIRDVPEIVVQFACYEALRRQLLRRRGDSKMPTYEHVLLGAAAGSIAATCTMPLDYLKTVIQCGRQERLVVVLAQTLRQEGVPGLFRGMRARVLMTSTMSAAFFGLFEVWKQVLKPADRRDVRLDRNLAIKVFSKQRTKIYKRNLQSQS